MKFWYTPRHAYLSLSFWMGIHWHIFILVFPIIIITVLESFYNVSKYTYEILISPIFVADFIHVIFRSARKTTFLVNFKMGFCVHFIHWKTLKRLKEIRLFGGVWLKLWNVFHKNTFSWTEIYNDENDCANNISSIQKCMQKMFLCLFLLNVDMLIV